jgi:GntR family transcriptional regulator
MKGFELKLDFRSGTPIYEQLVAQIKHMIATRIIEPGDQLPTVRQIAADLRVNFNTVARAYRLLDEAGIISTQHGRGTYILDSPSPEVSEKLRREDLARMTKRYIYSAFELGFTAEEVQTLFEEKITAWRTNRTPPDNSE